MVDSLKDPIKPELYKGVYSIPCSCQDVYIGKIGIYFEVRLKEHCVDLKYDRVKKSALAGHAHLTRHHICMEKATIIAKKEDLTKRKVREKIEIRMNLDCMNMDDGKKISDTWTPLLHSLQKIKTQNRQEQE